MRDIEDGFAFGGERGQQVFEEARGNDIEAGKWLVEDEQLRVVHERGCDEYTLLHALGVERDRRIAPGFERQKFEQSIGFERDELFGHAAQTADKLEIFETGKMRVDVRFFRHVSKNCTIGYEIVVDGMAAKEHPALIWLQHAGDHLDCGRFAGTIGTEVADDFASAGAESLRCRLPRCRGSAW